MSSHLPSLPAFRAFAAVAREGSFARAAEKLNISTSAVSHQIRALEEQLGTPLLTRARNGAGRSSTGPTAAGEELLRAVEDALGRLAMACDAIRAKANQPRRRIVVSANGSFASLWLAARLAAFARQHPSVEWHVRSEELAAPRHGCRGHRHGGAAAEAGNHAATGQAALLRNPFPGMRPGSCPRAHRSGSATSYPSAGGRSERRAGMA